MATFCASCQIAFVPEPFPEQNEAGQYMDRALENMFENFFFSNEIQNANQQEGEEIIEEWIEAHKQRWNTHCKICRYGMFAE